MIISQLTPTHLKHTYAHTRTQSDPSLHRISGTGRATDFYSHDLKTNVRNLPPSYKNCRKNQWLRFCVDSKPAIIEFLEIEPSPLKGREITKFLLTGRGIIVKIMTHQAFLDFPFPRKKMKQKNYNIFFQRWRFRFHPRRVQRYERKKAQWPNLIGK